MQPVTILGLAVFLGVLFLRARHAPKPQLRNWKQWRGTAKVLLAAIVVWLVVSFNLQHLERSISGEPQTEPSTWERVIRTLADWGI